MATLAGQWMTTPVFWTACGFRNRNEWNWFLVKHPGLTELRQRLGDTRGHQWFWPVSAVPKVERLLKQHEARMPGGGHEDQSKAGRSRLTRIEGRSGAADQPIEFRKSGSSRGAPSND